MVRERARKQIAEFGYDAVPHLVQAAQGGHWQLRLEATRALAAIAEPNSATALAHQFDDSPEIGWAAAEGLRQMGRAGARAVLQQLMQNAGSHGVRISALHALREMHDPEIKAAIQPVVTALQDSAPASQAPVEAYAALRRLA
jgi:HEAT repeat protein